jgi:pyruvate dehydrogenase E2 component (dihydrolipoamide acetyltransferase)
LATDFVVPELGENVKAGDVVRVLVKPGDSIKKDQTVIELETDKATIEVPSSVEGTVSEVAVKQGEKIKVGQLILRVEAGAEGQKAATAAGKTADAAADKPKPQPAGAPEEGGLSQRGTHIAPDKPPTAEHAEPAEPQEPYDPEEPYEPEEPEEPKEPQEPQEREEAEQPRRKVIDISRGSRQPSVAQVIEAPADTRPVPAAPSVRRMARELGVDIRSVSGSGPGGRISEEDVKAFVRNRPSRGGAEPAPLPDLTKWGEVERKPMTNVRRVTAERLSAAWTAPHVTQHDKADITALEALRKKYADRAEAAGGKLTITAIMVKVIAEAMKRFPQFNASVDMGAEEIVYRKYINVGVAVDTERGLLVPVIRDADRKTITDLSVEVATAAQKARDRKLSPDDMAGGGMSITNLGGIGGTAFTPIINAPEVAILGMSRAEMQPFWTGDAFEPRLMLPLSLSYDHRLVDGADAARFLRWVCEALEQPLLLAL